MCIRDSSYYEERAKGGVGLVIVEATSIDVSGKTFLHGLDISDDRFIPGLRLLAERVHSHGAAVAIQLQHGGGRAHPDVYKRQVPSSAGLP